MVVIVTTAIVIIITIMIIMITKIRITNIITTKYFHSISYCEI